MSVKSRGLCQILRSARREIHIRRQYDSTFVDWLEIATASLASHSTRSYHAEFRRGHQYLSVSSALDIKRHVQLLNVGCVRPFSASIHRFSDQQDPRNCTPTENLTNKDFLSLKNFNSEEIKTILWTALDLKKRLKVGKELFQPLLGKSIALIFQKRSTRTRLSAESGISLLGGTACVLGSEDIHLGVNESVKDSARVLSGFVDLILARVYEQKMLDELADEAAVPVISGLSDMYHPLQTLADLQTLMEHFGYVGGLKIAWVGDGNNIIHSLMLGCMKMGCDLRVATPPGYECNADVVNEAIRLASKHGGELMIGNDPMSAVHMADVVVTDTWVSMGQEQEQIKRLRDFTGYQVDKRMMEKTCVNSVFLHCLPRKPYEVTDAVFYSEKSLVWQEAENRKWTVMAVMLLLLQQYTPTMARPKFHRGEK